MLSDDAFARLVAEDVKNKASIDQQNYLRSPETRERWKKTLYALISNLSEQIAGVDAEEAADAKRYGDMGKAGEMLLFESAHNHIDHRKKIERFRFYVEQRLSEADRLIALGDESVSTDLSMMAFLQKAITMHRDKMERYDLEPTVIDEALWAALDGKWVFGEITDADIP